MGNVGTRFKCNILRRSYNNVSPVNFIAKQNIVKGVLLIMSISCGSVFYFKVTVMFVKKIHVLLVLFMYV